MGRIPKLRKPRIARTFRWNPETIENFGKLKLAGRDFNQWVRDTIDSEIKKELSSDEELASKLGEAEA